MTTNSNNNPFIFPLSENRSIQSIIDEHHIEEDGNQPVTINTKTDLNNLIGENIAIPTHLKKYINTATEPLTQLEIQNLEIAIEKHYNISHPYFITSPYHQDLSNPTFHLEHTDGHGTSK